MPSCSTSFIGAFWIVASIGYLGCSSVSESEAKSSPERAHFPWTSGEDGGPTDVVAAPAADAAACTISRVYQAYTPGSCHDVAGFTGIWEAHRTFGPNASRYRQDFCTFTFRPQETATDAGVLSERDRWMLENAIPRDPIRTYLVPDCTCPDGTCERNRADVVASCQGSSRIATLCGSDVPVAVHGKRLFVVLPPEMITGTPSRLFANADQYPHSLQSRRVPFRQPGNAAVFAVNLKVDDSGPSGSDVERRLLLLNQMATENDNNWVSLGAAPASDPAATCLESDVYHARTNGWCETIVGETGSWKAHPTFASNDADAANAFCTFIWSGEPLGTPRDVWLLTNTMRQKAARFFTPDCTGLRQKPIEVAEEFALSDSQVKEAPCPRCVPGLVRDDRVYVSLPPELVTEGPSSLVANSRLALDRQSTATPLAFFQQPGGVAAFSVPIENTKLAIRDLTVYVTAGK